VAPTDASETPAEASSESTVEAPAGADAAVETPTAAEPVAEASAAEAPAAEASGADVDHDDGGGDHEDAGTLAAPIAPEEPPPPLPSIGEIFRGRVGAVAESGHLAIVNRLVDLKAARKRVDQAREDRTRVLGLVYGFNRGGFDVLVDGLRAFCPASGMSLGPVDDPAEFVGRKLEFSVPPAKAGTHGLVVSRRAILEREARKHARERAKTLQLGERVRGTVTQVRDFGLFIDIGGGLEGMVHVSEMSWDRSQSPADVARVGDMLEAQIIRLPDRKEKKERHERIGLSLKAIAADPWDAHGDAVAEGRVFKGHITRVAEFGAFVEVAPGVEGLLHVSELGTNLQHARDGAKEGDEVWVLIERADKKARRLSLSKLSPANVASLESGELTPESFKGRAPKQGAALKVIVDRVESHGLFVQIEGVLGRKGRGYIPNAEMATERGTDHRRKFPVGTKLDAKIIGTDRDGGLKLSRKALLQDEEKRAVQDYRREASKQGLGTFGDLLRARLGEKG
jgi:small subunit ribosomal protein S1